MLATMLNTLRQKGALVHNITNYVTVNDCANAILALGASPIMADDALEVEEIISICNALVINIGTLNTRTIESMILAGKKANALGKPVILDPVGAGASSLRTETVFRLLKEINFAIIRGNISEIKTVYAGSGSTKGVDADINDQLNTANQEEVFAFAKELSLKTGAVIAITGAIDLVTDGAQVSLIANGHPTMSQITGTGCMLSSMLGAYAGANPQDLYSATVAAVAHMGIAGERAAQLMSEKNTGTSTFRTDLIDGLSLIHEEDLERGLKVEQY